GITPRLQHVLDALDVSPAIVRTAAWDVIAWNRAAALVLTDYAALPPGERNVLRMMFGNPRVREAQQDWQSVARHLVAAFRADAARAGAVSHVADLVEELCRLSPEFASLWRENDVQYSGEGLKQLKHPVLGLVAFEYSSFVIDGRPDLTMVIYNPATSEDAQRIRALVSR
ncbi:MAG TPA: transcriptional regulator, partial [Acetobacteraceae bacterium]|nr:transcriptional regulator [Acetobacteraceae bacterium]